MAPKRYTSGSHYSGGGNGSSRCPGFMRGLSSYSNVRAVSLEYYINYVIFLFFFLCVAISLCFLRKKLTQKRLTGPLFWASMLFQILGWVLIVISVTLLECGAIRKSYFDFQIALNLFFNLGNYLLLVIVVWGVNSLLAERVENRQSAVKIITLSITGVMGVLTVALIGMICYILWTNTSAGQESLDTFAGLQQYYTTIFNYSRYAVAYWALYLLSAIAAGGLAISTITRMRSRNIHVGDILLWTVALFVCMVLWVVFQFIPYAANLDPSSTIQPVTYTAIAYLNSFFLLFSYICLIFISKSQAWKHATIQPSTYNMVGSEASAFVPATYPAQPYYGYQGGQQSGSQEQRGSPYYDPPQSASHGAPGQGNGNGNM